MFYPNNKGLKRPKTISSYCPFKAGGGGASCLIISKVPVASAASVSGLDSFVRSSEPVKMLVSVWVV
jgi:hypothetical protein